MATTTATAATAPRLRAWLRAGLWVATAVSAVVFVAVALVVWHAHGPVGVDGTYRLELWSPRLHHQAFLGSPQFVFTLVGLLAVVTLVRRDLFAAALCAVGPALAGLCEIGAKHVVGRALGTSLSYPSGHATLAGALAAVVAVRARNGVPPLATDGQLISVARAWSAQMAGPAGLSHNPDLGSQVSNWRTLGENVGTGGDVASVEAALEASPHHFQNMVDPAFQYVGIGVVEAGGAIWVTEDFKQPKTGSLPATQVPQPAPKPAPRPPSPPAPVHSSPAGHAAGAHSSAAPPAAAAGAGAPSANASLASATPAPNASVPTGSEPARSHSGALPQGLAVVSRGPVMDGARFASLVLFAVLGAAAILAVHGRLPGVPRLR